MRNRGTSSRTLASVAVLSLLTLVSVAACSGSDDAPSAQTDSGSAGGGAAPDIARQPQDGVNDRTTDDFAASLPDAQAYNGSSATDPSQKQQPLITGEALIKTGSVSLRSSDINHVLTQVYAVVGGVGGDISREDTATDDKGKAVRSTLVLRVPVEQFDSTLNDLSRLGTLVNRVRNSKDVTTAVADIDSRVRSAQRSINTLRQLFGQATKLSDIIRLESELSQRESDLESLETQQRSLADKTTMSMITMTLELPPVTAKPKPKEDDDKAGGFVAGIQDGWNALRSTTIAVGHTVGVVLPLGTVALLLAGLVYWLVRRFSPHASRSPEEPAEA